MRIWDNKNGHKERVAMQTGLNYVLVRFPLESDIPGRPIKGGASGTSHHYQSQHIKGGGHDALECISSCGNH